MDTRLHHLQSEAELVTPAELAGLLQNFHRETADLVAERQARARFVSAYEANNVYQQVLGRQDVHLRWLSDAIADLTSQAPADPPSGDSPASSERQADDLSSVIEADARSQREFIARWTPRVEEVANARHRKMLQLILGEMAEHLRAFEQSLEGRTDMLGRHSDGKVLRGTVLATRPRN